MPKSPVVSFFLPNVVGGVASVIRNIITYLPQDLSIEKEIILYENVCEAREQIKDVVKGVITHRVSYHAKDNMYAVASSMRSTMNRDTSIIVATDYVELTMIEIEKLKSRVLYVVLGGFEHYYQTAILHSGIIDVYIAISKEIYTRLCELLPDRVNDIRLLYFPTPPVLSRGLRQTEKVLKVLYVARFDEGKNPLVLPRIDDVLKAHDVEVQWTLVGDGSERKKLESAIASRNNFRLTGFLATEGLQEEYCGHDIYIMTSFREGLPVSLIEAMKAGLVPVVSDIAGGIREVVTDGTGYLCSPTDADEFARAIMELNDDRVKLGAMIANAERSANLKFNHLTCAASYWHEFLRGETSPKSKEFNFRGSFLDRKFLPNGIVRLLRGMHSWN